MHKAKLVSMPFAGHFNLHIKQIRTSEKEKAKTKNVPYSSALGSLMYDMICSRPDIAYVVCVISAIQFSGLHLRGTTKRCLCFSQEKLILVGYTYVDLAGGIDFRKSTSGKLTIFFLGSSILVI